MNKKTILLIEDNVDDRFLLKKFLSISRLKNWLIIEKERLSESVEFTQENKPTVILLDLSLPDSIGEKSFDIMQINNQDVPIIVLTGLSDLTLAKTLIHKGAQDYLVKGEFDGRLLEKAIDYAIERHALKLENNKSKELFLESVLKAQDNERARISKELHDGVVQSLTAVSLNLNLLKLSINNSDAKGLTHYEKCNKNLSITIDEIRSLSHSLMPRSISELSLEDALESLIEDIKNTTSLKFEFIAKLESDPEEKLKITIYRIVQELINNAIKHSEADNLMIQIIEYTEQISLMIEDNGIGFDVSEVTQSKDCFGLQSLESRVGSLQGGNLEYDSKVGYGTNILVTFSK